MKAKPNATTEFVLAHPVVWCVGTAIAIGLLGLAVFQDWRAGAIGAVALFAVNVWLWRPGGIGRRWAERERAKAAGSA